MSIATNIAARCHVYSTDLQVIRETWKTFDKDARNNPQLKEARKIAYQQVLQAHHKHQNLVKEFRL